MYSRRQVCADSRLNTKSGEHLHLDEHLAIPFNHAHRLLYCYDARAARGHECSLRRNDHSWPRESASQPELAQQRGRVKLLNLQSFPNVKLEDRDDHRPVASHNDDASANGSVAFPINARTRRRPLARAVVDGRRSNPSLNAALYGVHSQHERIDIKVSGLQGHV